MSNAHVRSAVIAEALLLPATQKLIEFVDANPDADLYGGASLLSSCTADGAVETKRWTDTEGKTVRKPRTIQATRFVADLLAGVIDAEGPAALANCDRPHWAENILARAQLLSDITEYYVNQSTADGESPLPIDRSRSAWAQIVRRNVTLPAGLVYEVEAVRQRLAESESQRKISFSGILEVALRDLLKRPVDEEDGRFYDDEVGDFWFQPDSDSRTIADIVTESEIRGRRPSVLRGAE